MGIVSVIERTGIRLERESNLFKTHCPFHSDKTPSLKVYPHTDSWHCFGCQAGGDDIEFIKLRYGYNYRQAKEWLETNFSFNVKSELPILEIKKPKPVPHSFVVYWHSMLGDMRSYFHSRGFIDKTIDREMWGWDGQRYCIPVWEGQPQFSECLGVRKRKVDGLEGPKYIGLKGMNPPTIWGRFYCQDAKTVLAFAGEFDACLACQDGFASFSIVNGVGSIEQFPANWPELWFPKSQQMIVIFDKKEEVYAGRLASKWNKHKGTMQAKVFHWLGDSKDYNNFREDYQPEDFKELIYQQLGVRL